jgi:hypothetical protein
MGPNESSGLECDGPFMRHGRVGSVDVSWTGMGIIVFGLQVRVPRETLISSQLKEWTAIYL